MMKENKIPQEMVEFQPDALELKNERLPFAIRFCVWMPFIVMLAAIIWASLAEVDVIVEAPGKLVSRTPNITIKPLERTVIKKINVKVGDVVKPDQILITFDPTIHQAENERLEREVATLTAQFNRLYAEFTDKEYKIEDKNQDDQRWQHAIYLQRRSYYKERMNYFKQEIERCKAQQETTRESHKTQTGRLKAIKQIEDIIADLQKKRVASIKEELEISISRMQMEVEVDRLRNNLKELEHEEQSVIASRNSFMEEWRKAISEEMVKVRRELTSTLMEYQKQRQLATYVYLRAPCEAVVHEIASFSEGSAVREAEALVTLVPIDAGIELEAEIAPKDIGRIHKGAQARIKLNSFPFQKHGTLEGEVVDISEDTLQKQEQGGNRAYYRAKMTVSGKLKNITEKFRLIPGMETQCEIKVGRRRVIEYIIHPLIKSLDEAIREP
ncbi:MAG: HlyD family type I secretion periplasmic adaptor subunit [Victivallales bacterium]